MSQSLSLGLKLSSKLETVSFCVFSRTWDSSSEAADWLTFAGRPGVEGHGGPTPPLPVCLRDALSRSFFIHTASEAPPPERQAQHPTKHHPHPDWWPGPGAGWLKLHFKPHYEYRPDFQDWWCHCWEPGSETLNFLDWLGHKKFTLTFFNNQTQIRSVCKRLFYYYYIIIELHKHSQSVQMTFIILTSNMGLGYILATC